MDLFTIFAIAVGVARDAFAVSVASGLAYCSMHISHTLRIALFFGGFQAIMPVVGWLAGLTLRPYIVSFDHWLAFSILVFLGAKMIYEALVIRKAEESADVMNLFVLLGLAVATSIDALAVGVTFAFLSIVIITPVLVIGAVTFAMSFAGVVIGQRCGELGFSSTKIEMAGGVVLIAIGVKILVEHMIKGI
jgi:putative Mn2+ efflux pump MntP